MLDRPEIAKKALQGTRTVRVGIRGNPAGLRSPGWGGIRGNPKTTRAEVGRDPIGEGQQKIKDREGKKNMGRIDWTLGGK